jgi:hypothetical protein
VNISVGVSLGPANFHHKVFLMNSRLLVVVVVLSSKPCAQVACAYDNAYLIIVLFSPLNLLPAMQCHLPPPPAWNISTPILTWNALLFFSKLACLPQAISHSYLLASTNIHLSSVLLCTTSDDQLFYFFLMFTSGFK